MELKKISGGSSIQDINKVDLFQSASNYMEDNPWMKEIRILGSRN